MTIGKVAQRTGVGIETVRFYEREGLLQEPQRRASGYRQYDESVIARLRFIRRAKELGFTLKEIIDLLSLRVDPAASRADVKRRAQVKIADIDQRIQSLRRMRKALAKLTAACSGHGTTSECPILEAMGRKENGNG
jgi:Hg(II)-responsive transcriptional regulator